MANLFRARKKTSSPIPDSLESATWAQIKSAIADGTITQFAAVGDTKSFNYGNQTLHAQLVNIGDNTTQINERYYPLGTADFITVECLNTKYKLWETAAGPSEDHTTWRDLYFRTILNTDIYNNLPSDLKEVIINKYHIYDCGYSAPQFDPITQQLFVLWYTSYEAVYDKLWLPTTIELGLTGVVSDDNTYNKTYSVFSDNNSRIKKVYNNASNWWTSSKLTWSGRNYAGFSYEYVINAIYNTGTLTNNSNNAYPTIQNGVPLCFRIG